MPDPVLEGRDEYITRHAFSRSRTPVNPIRVFVNSGVLELPAGSVVAEAVRRFDPALSERVARGEAYVTDGRGIDVDPAETLANGAILRVIVRARRGSDADA